MMGSRFLSVMAALLIAAPSSAFAGPSISVPEPSSLALLAAGLGGAAIIKFRKRK
jgi:PEP-CTERM motif-containing protein